MNGGVIAQAFLDHVADILSDEKAVHAKVVRQLAVGVGRLAEGEQVDDFRVGQFVGALAQRADEFERLARAGADEDALAGPDFFDRVRGGENLRLISLLPVGRMKSVYS